MEDSFSYFIDCLCIHPMTSFAVQIFKLWAPFLFPISLSLKLLNLNSYKIEMKSQLALKRKARKKKNKRNPKARSWGSFPQLVALVPGVWILLNVQEFYEPVIKHGYA